MIKLRSYQEEAINVIFDTFKKQDRQYIVLPTGAGKTVTFLSYAKKYHSNILIIVPSIQLLNQVYENCLIFYPKESISRKGGDFFQIPKSVHICVAMSLKPEYIESLSFKEFDLIIIDEAHHSLANNYKRFINFYAKNHPNSKFLGVTATPERLDGQFLTDVLHKCSYEIEIPSLIEKGFLCDIEGYNVKTKLNISNVDHSNGDFSIGQLFKALCIDSRNNMIRDLCLKDMKDRKCIIFCINIQHSKIINNLLTSSGMSSAHIDGKMDLNEREAILKSFRNNEINFLTNCQLLTEGFDEPTIDGVILARPTKSRALFLQMIGRGLRISKGKENCKIIDIVDNSKVSKGFNALISDTRYEEINDFKSFKDIREHVSRETLKVTEFKVSRIDLFNSKEIDDELATESMIDNLKKNNIQYFDPITFDEASFLIWKYNLYMEFKKWQR